MHPYVKIAASIGLTLVLLFAFAGVYMAAGVMDDVTNDSWLLQVHNIALGAAWVAALFVLFRKGDGRKARELGFAFDRRDGAFLLAALLLSLAFAVAFVAALPQWTTMTVRLKTEFFRSGAFYALLLVSAVGWSMAALKEEALARGYFMFQLRRLGVGGMIGVSAVLFAAIHFPAGGAEWTKAASWFAGGVLYAYLYLKSGSLTVSTIAHGIHNLVNELLLGRAGDFSLFAMSEKVDGGDKLIYEIALKLSLLLLTAGWYRRTGGILTPSSRIAKLWGSP